MTTTDSPVSTSTLLVTPSFSNPVLDQLADTVVKGINEISAANEIFFAETAGTPVREINAQIKLGITEDSLSPDIAAAAKKLYANEAKIKEQRASLVNLYRTTVLGEEEQTDNEVTDEQKAEFKELHSNLKKMLDMLVTFAGFNSHTEALAWAATVEIPKYASKATSNTGGTGVKRARVFVTIGDTVYDSFTEANKALKVPSGTLQAAWSDAQEAETFTFADQRIEVVAKASKSDDE